MRYRAFTLWSIVIVSLIGLYVGYLKFTYIDDDVTSGEAYGFSIGDSKEAAYKKARELFASQKVFIEYPLYRSGHGPWEEFNFQDAEYKKLKERDVWRIYFEKRNFIRLSFKGDKLEAIYRHRQYFEFP